MPPVHAFGKYRARAAVFLIGGSGDELSVLAGDALSRPRLREWLAQVPDLRKPKSRWHPLEFVLALAVCALTAACHDPLSAITDWAADCTQDVLGGRRDGAAYGRAHEYRRRVQCHYLGRGGKWPRPEEAPLHQHPPPCWDRQAG